VIWFFASRTLTAQENAVFHEIHAKAFVLKDENGLNRAILTMVADGPALELFDETGFCRAELSVHANESWLGLYDENSNARAELSVIENEPGLELYAANRIINKKNIIQKPVWSAPYK